MHAPRGSGRSRTPDVHRRPYRVVPPEKLAAAIAGPGAVGPHRVRSRGPALTGGAFQIQVTGAAAQKL
uniref:Uncharacterized protein n=1 Tax=Ralstonia solanacearum CFBP2957 TaxID=859656 RepID=D8P424_RALSL|nr:protein of unknown function [Ralstonia solanacearum CFBP2957]